MPLPRTRRERIQQVARWLRVAYPPARPTKVQIASLKLHGPDGHYADCSTNGRGLLIRIHKNLTWYLAVESLIHEWAHARVWGVKEAPHGPAWSAAHGEIYSHFYDGDGWFDSREF